LSINPWMSKTVVTRPRRWALWKKASDHLISEARGMSCIDNGPQTCWGLLKHFRVMWRYRHIQQTNDSIVGPMRQYNTMRRSLKNLFATYVKQQSPADADKPARRKSMQTLLQFDVFRFISPNSISPNIELPMHSVARYV